MYRIISWYIDIKKEVKTTFVEYDSTKYIV